MSDAKKSNETCKADTKEDKNNDRVVFADELEKMKNQPKKDVDLAVRQIIDSQDNGNYDMNGKPVNEF